MKGFSHVRLDNVSFRYFIYSAFLVSILLISSFSKADVALPPSSTSQVISQAPHGSNLDVRQIRGVGTLSISSDGRTGTLNVTSSRPQFNSNVLKSANGIPYLYGAKNLNATFTDSYGTRATGQINTQTQLPKSSLLAKAGGAYMAGAVAGSVVNSPHAENAIRSAKSGNYTEAALSAAASFDVFGIGSGINHLKDVLLGEEPASRNMRDAIQQAATAKANAAAERAQQQFNYNENAQKYLPDPITGKPKEYPKLLIWSGGSSGVAIAPHDSNASGGTYDGFVLGNRLGVPGCKGPNQCQITSFKVHQVTDKNYAQYAEQIKQAVANSMPQPTIEDYLLTQAELQDIMTKQLESMLANQQANTNAINNLANALWANGDINAGNTQTQVLGSPTENTFVTAPYTPVGSSQAQQTQFTVNKDGSITVSQVPRPDLPANSSQAPTRSQIPTNNSSSTNQNQNTNQNELCKNGGNSLMCMELGYTDYQDVVLPTHTIDLSLNPLNIFQSDAQCPADYVITFLGRAYSISYTSMCKTAQNIRPWLIMIAMFIAFAIARRSIENL